MPREQKQFTDGEILEVKAPSRFALHPARFRSEATPGFERCRAFVDPSAGQFLWWRIVAPKQLRVQFHTMMLCDDPCCVMFFLSTCFASKLHVDAHNVGPSYILGLALR